jgi:hypothetical protein
MSKSKSHHRSRPASAASGAAKAPSTTDKTPLNSSVSTATEEKQETAATTAKLSTTANKAPVKSRASAAAEEKRIVAAPAGKPASATGNVVRPAASSARSLTRDAAKYERRQAERQQRLLAERRARRNKIVIWTSAILIVAIIGSLVTYFVYQSRQPAAHASSAQAAAPYQEAVFDSNYPPVDNVYCDQLEQSVEHIHMHLTMYINGQQSALPANIGIPTNSQSGQATCFYWLHVHQEYPGVIHIESPTSEPFNLGQFLDIWNQQFNSLGYPSQLLLPSGWTIWLNGKVYHGRLASVPLAAHNLITIAYNSPNAKPDTVFNWSGL